MYICTADGIIKGYQETVIKNDGFKYLVKCKELDKNSNIISDKSVYPWLDVDKIEAISHLSSHYAAGKDGIRASLSTINLQTGEATIYFRDGGCSIYYLERI